MTLFGKLETDVEIEAPASKFHEIFHQRPHHISNVSSDKIQGCEIHEGEWGKVGSIVHWNYVHDGKSCVAKEIIEAVDEENNMISFKVVEGDLLEAYKSFKLTIHCLPKEDKGSVIHWTLEYEKLHDEVPDSHSLLQFCVDVSKDIEAHLMEDDKEPVAQAEVTATAQA
ncbi:MLP-like protein 43 [Cucurbita maxima]|uniref:MLP-like protein 43 n=1 Tax=Cucurbita maxima TaxID=3661 RepID=A0A6J1I826_CUCMA|nr:MLP-like protein 43 [Cucurbita maxima]